MSFSPRSASRSPSRSPSGSPPRSRSSSPTRSPSSSPPRSPPPPQITNRMIWDAIRQLTTQVRENVHATDTLGGVVCSQLNRVEYSLGRVEGSLTTISSGVTNLGKDLNDFRVCGVPCQLALDFLKDVATPSSNPECFILVHTGLGPLFAQWVEPNFPDYEQYKDSFERNGIAARTLIAMFEKLREIGKFPNFKPHHHSSRNVIVGYKLRNETTDRSLRQRDPHPADCRCATCKGKAPAGASRKRKTGDTRVGSSKRKEINSDDHKDGCPRSCCESWRKVLQAYNRATKLKDNEKRLAAFIDTEEPLERFIESSEDGTRQRRAKEYLSRTKKEIESLRRKTALLPSGFNGEQQEIFDALMNA